MAYVDSDHTEMLKNSREYRDWFALFSDLKKLVDQTEKLALEGAIARRPRFGDDQTFLMGQYVDSVKVAWHRWYEVRRAAGLHNDTPGATRR